MLAVNHIPRDFNEKHNCCTGGQMYVTAAYFSQHDKMAELLIVSVEQPLPGITGVMTLIKGMQ